MAFIGVEFVSDEKLDSGAIALVHLTWLTPRKKDVWWPPYKTSSRFNKALSVGEEPREDTWTLCQIDRILFSCNDLDKANKKLIIYEEFSDVQSSALEDENQIKKRKRKRNLKYISSNEEDSDENNNTDFHRPPKILKTTTVLQKKESVTPQFMSYNSKQKDYLSQQVTNLDSSISSCSTSTKTLQAIDSLHQSAMPLCETAISSSPITVPTNKTYYQSESLNKQLDTFGVSHSHTFAEQVFIEIRKMREQMKEIHGMLKLKTQSDIPPIYDNFPIEFPLETREKLELLENHLNTFENQNIMISYLSRLGGDTITSKSNKILKHIFTNEFAMNFNFAGQKNKEGFGKFRLKNVIVRAVQMKLPSSTEADIEKAIKTWLKHASDRIKIKEKKNIGENNT